MDTQTIQALPDTCTQCQIPALSNASWIDDKPYCTLCALGKVHDGHRAHGSRVQGRLWDAADQFWPDLHADQWLWEEYPVVLSGRNFRADFTVQLIPWAKIAIEIDSFAHHSSAMAITRDRQRQRLFQKGGWHVIRFSGQEVWHDPRACVEELIEIIARITEPLVATLQSVA